MEALKMEHYEKLLSSASIPNLDDVLPIARKLGVKEPSELWRLLDRIRVEWTVHKNGEELEEAE